MKSISIEAYAKKIGYKGDNPTLEEIQEFAECELDETLWDYPLSELEHAKEMCNKIVLVDTEQFGIRVCELL